LALVHPATGQDISWSSPLPEDFQALLSQLTDEKNDI
jgi:hypothetical protein